MNATLYLCSSVFISGFFDLNRRERKPWKRNLWCSALGRADMRPHFMPLTWG
jgi:hypothetical protein